MSDNFSPRFPTFLDSTMLSSFRNCPKKFYWEYILRLRPKGESIHLVAGGAFAKGLEVARKLYYDKGASMDIALQAAVVAALKAYTLTDVDNEWAKSPRAICEALNGYLTRWPLDQDYLRPVKQNGKHWVEFSFAIPLPIKHPVTGEDLLYVGRCDMIAEFAGAIYTVDEKTCSQMGESWARKFDMRAQFMGYNWAAQQHGFNVVGTVVRGIKFIKSGQEFGETIVMHSNLALNNWFDQTMRDIERMIKCWNEGYWDMNLGDVCTMFSGCPFQRLENTTNPEGYFEVYYKENTWNPMDKGDD